MPASVRLVHFREWLVGFMEPVSLKHRESEWGQGQMDALRKCLIELDSYSEPEWQSYMKVGGNEE